jgi:ADP-L-glycero-D-manno-heptose 6-epimerase
MILLTGYQGFIGKNFVEYFNSNNIKYKTYDIKDGYLEPAHFNLYDVTKVIHLWAVSSTTETDVDTVMNHNLVWSIKLFEECVKRDIHFQWASSASVYGKRSASRGAFKTTDECNPQNLYAMSKFLLEQYIINRAVDNIIWQGFRYFNVYGPNEEHKGSQASPHTQFEIQAKQTGIIRVFAGSENYCRDFVPVDHVIKTHMQYSDNNISGIFNAGTGFPKSFMCVAEEVAKKYNAKIETIAFPEHLKKHYQEYTCASLN